MESVRGLEVLCGGEGDGQGVRRGRNPVGIGDLVVRRTQGRPAVQANPGLGDAIPLGLVRRCQFDWWAYS